MSDALVAAIIKADKIRTLETRLTTLQARGDRLAEALQEVLSNSATSSSAFSIAAEALTEWRKGC